LVGGDIPKLTKRADYSFSWAGAYKKDDMFKYFTKIMKAKRVPEFIS